MGKGLADKSAHPQKRTANFFLGLFATMFLLYILLWVLPMYVWPNYQANRMTEQATQATIDRDVRLLSEKAEVYREHHARYPDSLDQLLLAESMAKPWSVTDLPRDPWYRYYQYKVTSEGDRQKIKIWSLGQPEDWKGGSPSFDPELWAEIAYPEEKPGY